MRNSGTIFNSSFFFAAGEISFEGRNLRVALMEMVEGLIASGESVLNPGSVEAEIGDDRETEKNIRPLSMMITAASQCYADKNVDNG